MNRSYDNEEEFKRAVGDRNERLALAKKYRLAGNVSDKKIMAEHNRRIKLSAARAAPPSPPVTRSRTQNRTQSHDASAPTFHAKPAVKAAVAWMTWLFAALMRFAPLWVPYCVPGGWQLKMLYFAIALGFSLLHMPDGQHEKTAFIGCAFFRASLGMTILSCQELVNDGDESSLPLCILDFVLFSLSPGTTGGEFFANYSESRLGQATMALFHWIGTKVESWNWYERAKNTFCLALFGTAFCARRRHMAKAVLCLFLGGALFVTPTPGGFFDTQVSQCQVLKEHRQFIEQMYPNGFPSNCNPDTKYSAGAINPAFVSQVAEGLYKMDAASRDYSPMTWWATFFSGSGIVAGLTAKGVSMLNAFGDSLIASGLVAF